MQPDPVAIDHLSDDNSPVFYQEVKRNRKDALELARSVADIVQALVDATQWLEDDEIDERFKADIYEFHQYVDSSAYVCLTM